MPKKKNEKSKTNSTKWQQFVTNLNISKLFQGLILTILIKLVVIGTLAWDMPLDHGTHSTRVAVNTNNVKKSDLSLSEHFAMSQAVAADEENPKDKKTNEENKKSPTTTPMPGSENTESTGLGNKADELARKEKNLKTLEKEIDAKLARLQELEAKLSRMIEEANEVKDKKLKHLIDVYSNMKSKQAATVIENLDQKTAVKILAGMRGRQAGEILQYVKAEVAASLTEQLTKMQVPFN